MCWGISFTIEERGKEGYEHTDIHSTRTLKDFFKQYNKDTDDALDEEDGMEEDACLCNANQDKIREYVAEVILKLLYNIERIENDNQRDVIKAIKILIEKEHEHFRSPIFRKKKKKITVGWL